MAYKTKRITTSQQFTEPNYRSANEFLFLLASGLGSNYTTATYRRWQALLAPRFASPGLSSWEFLASLATYALSLHFAYRRYVLNFSPLQWHLISQLLIGRSRLSPGTDLRRSGAPNNYHNAFLEKLSALPHAVASYLHVL